MPARTGASGRIDVVVHRFVVDAHDAQRGLMRAFHLDRSGAQRFVDALPCVAKHDADASTADRYAAALRSIGAEVQFVDSVSGAPLPSGVVSLPTPSSSLAPAFSESMRVERATDDAVARFKAEEEISARPWGADHDPIIPQAPRLPHDLGRMPNARTRSEDVDEVEPRTSTSPPRHPAAAPPPRTSIGGAGRTTHRTSPAPATGASAGLQRPGSGPPLVLSLPPEPERRALWPVLLIALVATSAFALQRLGVFSTEADANLAAWAREGIVGGEHAPLPDWLDRPERSVEGVEPEQLLKLLGGLQRAGATHVWAIRIPSGGDLAGALLVELPRDPEARRTILWQLGRSPGHDPTQFKERGQQFQEVMFAPRAAP